MDIASILKQFREEHLGHLTTQRSVISSCSKFAVDNVALAEELLDEIVAQLGRVSPPRRKALLYLTDAM